MMEEEKRRGSPLSWGAMGCGALSILTVSGVAAACGVASPFLAAASVVCGVVALRRRERLRRWGLVGAMLGLLVLVRFGFFLWWLTFVGV